MVTQWLQKGGSLLLNPSNAKSGFDFTHHVQFFPWKQLSLSWVTVSPETFTKVFSTSFSFSAHVTISGCLRINRSAQIESLFDGVWSEVENFRQLLGNFTITQIYIFDVAIRFNKQPNGLVLLQWHRPLEQGLHPQSPAATKIFSNMSRSISCRAVNLAWVFPAESTTTMSSFTTVCVNDYLSPCQTRITMWASDHKFSGRIYVINDLVVE